HSLSFSIHTPPPPTASTPFPYTTLFRSREGLFRQPRRLRRRIGSEGAAYQAARVDGSGRRQCALSHPRGRPRAHATVLLGGRHQDRKSTRLNSSHGSISYAVFCLKKKII